MSDGVFGVVGARAPLAFFSRLERIGHAYLFSGPAGVGKKTFARRLAQSLLCEAPKTALLGYCERCPSCRLFAARTHPDFVESEATIKIGKEGGSAQHDAEFSARDLVRELSLHGYRSRYRIVLLGDVAFATHEAANALLKFFEEPPGGVVVFLTSDAPGSLLPTIRSRLVEVAFSPLSAADVASVLVADGIAGDKARLAAEVALGSITRARSILDDDASGFREAAFAWFAHAASGERPDGGFLRLDDRSLNGAQKRAVVLDLIEIVRTAARDWAALTLGGERTTLLAADQRERFARLPARNPSALVALLAGAAESERLARTNVSAGLVVDHLRMQLAPR
ncbi:MAG: DNA polymerase III subunit [Candidatus Eremiobacteraeota bacterium]|nr:DNA polymerase III subunit [Candidatus Eremiobacteraeota bacterium]